MGEGQLATRKRHGKLSLGGIMLLVGVVGVSIGIGQREPAAGILLGLFSGPPILGLLVATYRGRKSLDAPTLSDRTYLLLDVFTESGGILLTSYAIAAIVASLSAFLHVRGILVVIPFVGVLLAGVGFATHRSAALLSNVELPPSEAAESDYPQAVS